MNTMFKLMYRAFLIGDPYLTGVSYDIDGSKEYTLSDYGTSIQTDIYIKTSPDKEIYMRFSQHRNIQPVYDIDGSTVGYTR